MTSQEVWNVQGWIFFFDNKETLTKQREGIRRVVGNNGCTVLRALYDGLPLSSASVCLCFSLSFFVCLFAMRHKPRNQTYEP
jgi:hypothetical protein